MDFIAGFHRHFHNSRATTILFRFETLACHRYYVGSKSPSSVLPLAYRHSSRDLLGTIKLLCILLLPHHCVCVSRTLIAFPYSTKSHVSKFQRKTTTRREEKKNDEDGYHNVVMCVCDVRTATEVPSPENVTIIAILR